MRASSFDIGDLLDRDGVIVRSEHPELVNALTHLLRRGELTAVLPGVYARAETADTFETRILALNHHDPDVVLTGRAAARLGFWTELEVRTVTAACRNARADRPGFAFTKRDIDENFVIERHRTRLMSPALAALDLCTELNGDGIDTVLRTKAATIEQLREAIEATRYARGQRQRRRLLLESRAEPWSAAERKLHLLLHRAGITGWRANVEIRCRGKTYYPDVAFPAERVIVEVDSKKFHGWETFETDRARQNDLVLDGWLVLRITWQMLDADPDGVVERVVEALEVQKTASRTR